VSEEYSPLLTLAHKLRSLGPPSLAILFARFESVEDYKDFVALVREYLPEREQEILRQPDPSVQIVTFVSHFTDRYFPLEEGFCDMVEGYEEFLYHIPVVVMGVSYDDYHEIPESYRDGLQLMTYLLEDPYEGSEGGARVALAEACLKHVPADLLHRVPGEGLSVDDAHQLLDNTPYAAVANWGDVLTANTGNFFLDTDYEYLCNMEMFEWDRETVDYLIHHWQLADLAYAIVYKLAEWLEEDPPNRFREVLDFIEGKNRDEPDPRQGILALDFT